VDQVEPVEVGVGVAEQTGRREEGTTPHLQAGVALGKELAEELQMEKGSQQTYPPSVRWTLSQVDLRALKILL